MVTGAVAQVLAAATWVGAPLKKEWKGLWGHRANACNELEVFFKPGVHRRQVLRSLIPGMAAQNQYINYRTDTNTYGVIVRVAFSLPLHYHSPSPTPRTPPGTGRGSALPRYGVVYAA